MSAWPAGRNVHCALLYLDNFANQERVVCDNLHPIVRVLHVVKFDSDEPCQSANFFSTMGPNLMMHSDNLVCIATCLVRTHASQRDFSLSVESKMLGAKTDEHCL